MFTAGIRDGAQSGFASPGTVSPDGRFVAALEAWGKLHFACLENDRFQPAVQTIADPQAVALALTETRIATVGGGEFHQANLLLSCASS